MTATAHAVVSPESAMRSPAARRARVATAAVFTVHGCVTGSLAARIPWIASHVGVGFGGLGFALLMPALGALLAMPFSGRLAHRYELRPFVTVSIVAWCGALALPALPTALWVLCVVLFVGGAAAGLADTAMNAEGVVMERMYCRSVMSGFHGFWSVGVLIGSAVSALSSHAGIDARLQFGVESVALALAGAAAARRLLNDHVSREAQAPPRFALPARPVLLIGLIGLCAVFGEQAGTDWSALYLRNALGGSASVAALAVSAFAVTMATARLVGDRVIRRIGPVASVRLSGVCASVGSVTVALAPDLAVGLVGFALLGVGVALVIPIVFATAGRIGPHAGSSIAGVAGVAYASGLAAPAVIGGIAAVSSLTASFCLVAGLAAVMALGAGVLRRGE